MLNGFWKERPFGNAGVSVLGYVVFEIEDEAVRKKRL